MLSCKPMYRLTLSDVMALSNDEDADFLSKGMPYSEDEDEST